MNTQMQFSPNIYCQRNPVGNLDASRSAYYTNSATGTATVRKSNQYKLTRIQAFRTPQ